MRKKVTLRRALAVAAVPLASVAVIAHSASAAESRTFSGNLTNGSHVRGNETTVLRADGSFNFNGHLHNYAAFENDNVTVVCVFPLNDGGGISVHAEGHVAAKYLPGSSDLNWNVTGHSDELAGQYGQLTGKGTCNTSTTLNYTALLTSVGTAVGVAGAIIALV